MFWVTIVSIKTSTAVDIFGIREADVSSLSSSSRKATARTGPPVPPLVLIAPRKIVVPFGGMLSRLAAYSRTGMLLPSRSTWTGLCLLTEISIEGPSTPTTLAWRSVIKKKPGSSWSKRR